MEKIIYFFSYLASLFNFFGQNEPLEYKVLTQEEMSENTDVKFVSSFEDEVVEETGTGTSKRNIILKKTKFLVVLNKRDWVLKLKKHLLVGRKNFTEYNETSDENSILQNRINSLNDRLKILGDEKEVHEDFILRLEKLIGVKQYNEYKNTIASIIERERTEGR